MFLLFQKESAYLTDMNILLNSAKQMGLIDDAYNKNMPNSTKCTTLKDIKDSHLGKNVVVKFNNIYGMLILFGFGIGTALLTLAAEGILKVRKL